MAGNVLVVCHDTVAHGLDENRLKDAGFTPVEASLYEKHATPDHPYWRNVVAQFLKDGTPLDGVILFDDSLCNMEPLHQLAHKRWMEADDEIEALQKATGPGFEINVETGDDVQNSIANREWRDKLDHMFSAHKTNRIGELEKKKNSIEDIFVHYATSQEGIECLQALKADDSPYKNTPAIVTFAYPEKAPQFLAAGAASVRTSDNWWNRNNTDVLIEEIDKQNKWAGEKKSFTDLAQNPPGGTWTSEKDL